MGEPGCIKRLAVEFGALNVFVYYRTVFCVYMKLFATGQVNADLFKQGAANGVYRVAGGNGIKTHRGEHYEGRHTTAVFIAGNAKDVVFKPYIEQKANALLRFPGTVGEIIQIRNVKARFI